MLHRVTSVSTVTCTRCGAVHHRDGDVISPPMGPIPAEGRWRASPWMSDRVRPVAVGNYQAHFDGIVPWVPVHWNGHYFTRDGRWVSCTTLRKWRGDWMLT